MTEPKGVEIWPLTGEVMEYGSWPLKLSYHSQSIVVPVAGWWAHEANDGIVDPDQDDITVRVRSICLARANGMRITLIAAADEAWGIGMADSLPWRCREDLLHFKERTMGRNLLMGRRTFEGLPVTLDGRFVHVISSNGPEHLTSVDRAIAHLVNEGADEVVIAGGGRLYAEALPYCTHAEVTRIPGVHQCDTHMPDLAKHGWGLSDTKALTDNINIQYWEPSK